MRMDLFNNIKLLQVLGALVRSATTTTLAVDMAGFNSIAFAVSTDTVTDGTFAITVEASNDNVTFETVTEAHWVQGLRTLIATDDNKVFKVGYLGSKRYVRLRFTAAGTTTGGQYSVLAMLEHPRHAPAS